jgi:hypothetical protein
VSPTVWLDGACSIGLGGTFLAGVMLVTQAHPPLGPGSITLKT